MSHPNPSHDRENEYPADKVTHYPREKAKKMAKKALHKAKGGNPSISQIRKANKLFFSKDTTKFFGDKKHEYNRKTGEYHVKHEHGGHTYKVDPKTHKLNP